MDTQRKMFKIACGPPGSFASYGATRPGGEVAGFPGTAFRRRISTGIDNDRLMHDDGNEPSVARRHPSDRAPDEAIESGPEAYPPMHACMPPAITTSSSRGAWLLRWRAGERKTVYLCALVLGAGAFFLVLYVQQIWAEYIAQTPGHPADYGDFFALWSYAKIAGTHPAAELYDSAILHARQVALGMDPDASKPFPYPPMFILMAWPLSILPYDVTYIIWIFATLALFVWAVMATCSRLPLCVFGVIIAPASTATIAAGQSGFFAAALITAGVRLAGSRPVLGGILLGILTYKPQLGILVPIALAAAGFWAAFRAACVTAIGLAVATTLVFGWAVWPAWISSLPVYAETFDWTREKLYFKPTVMANLELAGCTLQTAKFIQAFVALAVAVLIWRFFQRHPGRLATAALLTGTFLATPHAIDYDLTMVAVALALFIEARTALGATFSLAEIVILILAYIFPALMQMKDFNLPISTVPLALFFGLILWHARAAPARQPA